VLDDNDVYTSVNLGNYTTVTGNVTAVVDDSSIANKFTSNDISNNDGTGVDIYNYMEGYVYVSSTASSVGGNVLSTVTNGSTTNTFTTNTINDNNDEGVDIYSDMGAYANNNGTINGGLTTLVDTSSINDLFKGNEISRNYNEGINIYNYMGSGYSGTASGTVDGSISNSVVSGTFTRNTISANGTTPGDSGIHLYNYTYASDTDAALVQLLMNNNSITYNGDYGVYVEYDGLGTFTGDLGGGSLGAAGSNTLYGNNTLDLYNATSTEIKAENNWWNDNDPSDQVGGLTPSDTVDYTPWLTTAP